MYKILAVSGGIDSVTMLHLYRNDEQVVVAHFNHGIRDNANDDEEFVRDLAKKYKKPYFMGSANVGPKCSEDLARKERYSFLQSLSQELGGKIYAAHHKGDLAETVIINLTRGTGWRGLTPFENPNLIRPLLDWQKPDIYRYADKNQLIWRQDQSNTEGDYLRNRVRIKLLSLDTDSRKNLQKELDKLKTFSEQINKFLEGKSNVNINELLQFLISTKIEFLISPHAFKQGKRSINYDWNDEVIAKDNMHKFMDQFFCFCIYLYFK